jgi:hypothetical protein
MSDTSFTKRTLLFEYKVFSEALLTSVAMPRTISTNCMSGTGFIKCIPTTRSGLRVAEAMRVMEIELVLDARMASLPTICSTVGERCEMDEKLHFLNIRKAERLVKENAKQKGL